MHVIDSVVIELLKKNNFMKEHDGRVSLTPKGMAVEHEIIATFFQVD